MHGYVLRLKQDVCVRSARPLLNIKTMPGLNVMSVSNPTLITFVIYIAAMVLIGLMAYRSTNNLDRKSVV